MEKDVPTSEYLKLIKSFLAEEISAPDFETKCMRLFKEDPRVSPSEICEVLNELFLDVENFCPDPRLRVNDKYAIDEAELRKRVGVSYEKLRALETKSG